MATRGWVRPSARASLPWPTPIARCTSPILIAWMLRYAFSFGIPADVAGEIAASSLTALGASPPGGTSVAATSLGTMHHQTLPDRRRALGRLLQPPLPGGGPRQRRARAREEREASLRSRFSKVLLRLGGPTETMASLRAVSCGTLAACRVLCQR